jgi:hypothetical protein
MGAAGTFLSEDKNFFIAVNNESRKLRATASEFVTFLMAIKNPPSEINLLIQATKNIKTMDIEKFDEVFNQLKDAMIALNLKMQEKDFIKIVSPYKLIGLAQKENKLVEEAYHLVHKADKLLIKKDRSD